jgi:hypothetical protein
MERRAGGGGAGLRKSRKTRLNRDGWGTAVQTKKCEPYTAQAVLHIYQVALQIYIFSGIVET